MKRATCEGCALTHKILQASVGPIGPIGPIGPTIVANSETSPGSSTDLLSKGYFPELLMLLYISQDIPRLLVSFASEFPNGNQTWYFQAAKLSKKSRLRLSQLPQSLQQGGKDHFPDFPAAWASYRIPLPCHERHIWECCRVRSKGLNMLIQGPVFNPAVWQTFDGLFLCWVV